MILKTFLYILYSLTLTFRSVVYVSACAHISSLLYFGFVHFPKLKLKKNRVYQTHAYHISPAIVWCMSVLFVNGRRMPQTNISNEKTFIVREWLSVVCWHCSCILSITRCVSLQPNKHWHFTVNERVRLWILSVHIYIIHNITCTYRYRHCLRIWTKYTKHFHMFDFRYFSISAYLPPSPQPVNANTNAIEKIANLMNARGHKKSFIVLWCF